METKERSTRRAFLQLALVLTLATLACAMPSLPGQEAATPTPELAPTVDANATPTLAPTIESATTDDGTAAGGVATPTLASAGTGVDGNGGDSTGDTGTGSVAGGDNGAGTGDDAGGGDDGGTGDATGDAGTGDAGGNGAAAGCSGGNLLVNGSFEGEFSEWGGIDEFKVADGWFPWHISDGQINFPPEYKAAEAALFPNRVMDGASAQQYFKSFGAFRAGLYQLVQDVPANCPLTFTVFGQAWSCEDENGQCPGTASVNPANMFMRVGIHPDGRATDGVDPQSRNIVWSDFFNPIDAYAPISVTATSQSDWVTVWLYAAPNGPRRNQDVYWDNASLVPGP